MANYPGPAVGLSLKKPCMQSDIIMQNEPYRRPDSALTGITDYGDSSRNNPSPESDDARDFGEFLSPQKIRRLSNTNDLHKVTDLTMTVDTSETSMGNLGTIVPNLQNLRLNNSVVTSIRDLGTHLNNLHALHMSRCCLNELDGISCFSGLKELFAPYNEIFDLSPLSMLDNLQVLDLEGNDVDDISQVEFLALCPKLAFLTLDGNPITKAPNADSKEADLKFYSYRDAILETVPQLEVLDNKPFLVELVNGLKQKRTNPQVNSTSSMENNDIDLHIIRESLKSISEEFGDEELVPAPDGMEQPSARPQSKRSRPQSNRSKTRMSTRHDTQSKATKVRASTAKPPTANAFNDDTDPVVSEFDDSSHLTHGSIICGNPVRALAKRRKDKQNLELFESTLQEISEERIFTPEHSYPTFNDTSLNDLLEELKQWRRDNEVILGKTPTKAASVKITYSPTPPKQSKSDSQVTPPSMNLNRSLPSSSLSPSLSKARPHTASDFRSRYFRRSLTNLTTNNSISESPEGPDITLSRSGSLRGTATPTPPKSQKNSPVSRPVTAKAALLYSKDYS